MLLHENLGIYRLLVGLGAKSSVILVGHKLPSPCARPANYGVLSCFSTKTSVFTSFWLSWVRNTRFFTHQMPSDIGGPSTAVELRWNNYLRHFGPLQPQNLATYRLWARLGWKSSVFYAPSALSYWWAQTAAELRGTVICGMLGLLQLQSLAIYRLLARLGRKSSVFYAPSALSYWWAPNCH